jgi:hypothetical protein
MDVPRGRLLIQVALSAALTAGCVVSGPVDVEALVRTADGQFALGTATLQSVVDLHRGSGELFDVRAGAASAALSGSRFAPDDASDGAMFAGSDVHADLSIEPGSGRYVANDFDSLLYLSTFHHFERALAYFHDVVGDRSTATTARTTISLYGHMVLAKAAPVPLPVFPAHDNAAYSPLHDFFVVLPVHDQDGIPMAMNPAVIAHEVHHRVFHWNYLTAAHVASDADDAVYYIDRAVDEGLADLNAFVMVGDLDGYGPSLQDAPWSLAALVGFGLAAYGRLRDLDGEMARNATFDEIWRGSDDDDLEEGAAP